jgi:hypothetical protein
MWMTSVHGKRCFISVVFGYERSMMFLTARLKNPHSNIDLATEKSRPAPPRPDDLDPIKGLALAVPAGLVCWGLFAWLFWRLL